jgi:hypothetical protein
MKTKVLFGVRNGAEDWQEELLTELPERIEAAKAWAIKQGFNPAKFRVVEIDLSKAPDFSKSVKRRKK